MFKIKQMMKAGGLLLVALGVAVFLFAFVTLYQLPLERLESYSSETEENSGQNMAKLVAMQAGASVPVEMLGTYWLFGPGRLSFGRWVKSLGEDIEISNERVLFLKDVPMSTPLENQCEISFCYQRRMSFERIPSVFWKGLIGIEDSRFLDHRGIDLRSIARAIYEDIKAMSLVQGGSTITQQLVKNLYFTNDKSFKRKLQEVFVSLYIEMRYPKENILESYFNEVFWGSLDGVRIKGLYASALFYFAKKPDQLSSYEASILIAMLKGPAYYHPLRNSKRLRIRVESVYARLKELNLFYGGENIVWSEEEWEAWRGELRKRVESRRMSALWRSLSIKNDVLHAFDKFTFVHQAKLLLGKLKKRTDGADLAIKAVVHDIKRPEEESFYYYSKYERSLKRALKSEKHQVGSLLKPILYSIYIQNGLSLDELVSTAPLSLDLKSGVWSPGEVARNFPEQLPLVRALQRSLNRPVVRLAQKVGLDKVEAELLKYFPTLLTPLSEYPAQMLGALELSLEELKSAYLSFISRACESRESSEVVWALSDPRKTTLANQVSDELMELPFFGKTGTSNAGLDNLFISFDGRYLSLIWVGLEGSRENQQLPLYGSTTAFQLYQNFVLRRGTRFGELNCEPTLP